MNIVQCYKVQTIMLNQILTKIQNPDPQICYIQGQEICETVDNKEIKHDGFYKPGIIDLHLNNTLNICKNNVYSDYYLIKKIDLGIKWLKLLKQSGHRWTIDNLKPYIYPNMCNNKDYGWRNVKLFVAKKVNEITLIHNISYHIRQKYHNSKIYSYKDIKFHKNNIINKMIKYNKINNNKTLNKLYKKYKLINIDSKYNGYTKLYVDFETTHYINNIINKFLYMIGIGYYIKNKWVFHNLVTERMNEDSEKSIILQFINIIKQFDKSVLIHWSNAEPSILNKLLNKYNINYNINWCDLLKIYIEKKLL